MRLDSALLVATTLTATTVGAVASADVESLMGNADAGTAVEVTCGEDRALVGVYGRAGLWINNMFLMCGLVRNGTVSDIRKLDNGWQRIGGLASGLLTKDYKVQCPAGQVAAGVMVYRGSYINQVGLYCRIWTTKGTTTGNLNGPAGGSGGTFDARTCTERLKPVTALHARHGLYIDALGVRCREP